MGHLPPHPRRPAPPRIPLALRRQPPPRTPPHPIRRRQHNSVIPTGAEWLACRPSCGAAGLALCQRRPRAELPRIPCGLRGKRCRRFPPVVKAGRRLAEIHVHYEQQPEFPLTKVEKPGEKLDYRVTKMKLGKDKTTLIYNQFLTLSGIPKETYDYRLGNRSALEWVIDQYQISTDKRSGITNDPNRADDPQYILRLIGQVIMVSLETVKTVQSLPPLGSFNAHTLDNSPLISL